MHKGVIFAFNLFAIDLCDGRDVAEFSPEFAIGTNWQKEHIADNLVFATRFDPWNRQTHIDTQFLQCQERKRDRKRRDQKMSMSIYSSFHIGSTYANIAAHFFDCVIAGAFSKNLREQSFNTHGTGIVVHAQLIDE